MNKPTKVYVVVENRENFMFDANPGVTTSNPKYDKVVVTSTAGPATTNQFLSGAVDQLQAAETTLPQFQAVAYLNNVVVLGVEFYWESSNPDVCTVDQNGNVTRTAANPNAATFDNNGTNSVGELGGISQISATALRADGSLSGVLGVIQVAVQNHGDGIIQLGMNNWVKGIHTIPPITPNPVRLDYILDGDTSGVN
jgi:hypothetical protein